MPTDQERDLWSTNIRDLTLIGWVSVIANALCFAFLPIYALAHVWFEAYWLNSVPRLCLFLITGASLLILPCLSRSRLRQRLVGGLAGLICVLSIAGNAGLVIVGRDEIGHLIALILMGLQFARIASAIMDRTWRTA